jgi:uncharacterized protein YbdZ (MbtH family)
VSSTGYQLEIRGHEQVIAQLEQTGRDLRPAMMSAMGEATALVLTTAVTRYLSGPPGLNRRTGQLAAGLDASVREESGAQGTQIVGRVFTNAEHGYHQEMPEEGSGVMVIRPRTKKTLAFVLWGSRPETPEGWRAAREEGRAVFARQVTLKRHAFLQPALEEREQVIFTLFENRLTRLVGGSSS